MFDPMIFPNTISSFSPEDPEIIFTTNSGAEVPIATTVSPMAMSDTLYLLAREEAPFTKKSAPLISITKPTMMSKKGTTIFEVIYVQVVNCLEMKYKYIQNIFFNFSMNKQG